MKEVLVNKEDVFKVIAENNCTDRMTLHCYDRLIKGINRLPTVKGRQKGEWIGLDYDGFADGCPVYDVFECTCCGWEHNGEEDTLTDYCPNCGAKMKEHLIIQQEKED